MQIQEYANMQTTNGEPVLLQSVRMAGDLKGLIFEMKVEQTFKNQYDTNIEAIYTFPLPWGAVLLGMEVLLGEKRLTGAVVAKKQAEANYEETLASGDAAVMLEQNEDHSYTLNIGNLLAGETCVITLRYAQTLQFISSGAQRALRVMIPTVIAPRYGNAMAGRLQPYQVPEHDLTAEYPFDIALRLHGNLTHSRVASPTHPVAVATASGLLTVTLARQSALDRDFVLVIDEMTHSSAAIAEPDCVVPGHYAALVSFSPEVRADSEASPDLALKVLVDCSGSMAGDSIEAAQRALEAIVAQLSAGDRFSLSRFGSTVEHRSRALWAINGRTRKAAERWVSYLAADLGGTEMEDALRSTFELAQTGGSDLLLITDGEIFEIDATIALAAKSGHRLFVVGIGSSPAEGHLRRLAKATGGACDFVAPGEAVEPAVLRMFARLRSPGLSSVEVLWPEGNTPVWTSEPASTVLDGDTLNVFALFSRKPEGTVHLKAKRLGSEEMAHFGQAAFEAITGAGDCLARVVASSRLEKMNASPETAQSQQACKLAVDYQLVTGLTNFLLIHERAAQDKSIDMPEQRKVTQMLAAGWGGTGQVVKDTGVISACTGTIKFCVPDDVTPSIGNVNGKRPVQMAPKYAPAHYGPAAPSVWRTNRTRAAGIDLVDKQVLEAVDHDDPKLYSESSEYKGLTPLGLSEWLRLNDVQKWPTTYEDLRSIGLGLQVTDWLEFTVGASHPEGAVIEAFLQTLSSNETYAALTQKSGLLEVLTAMLRSGGWFGKKQYVSTLDQVLLKRMAAALAGVTAVHWPSYVFDMEEA